MKLGLPCFISMKAITFASHQCIKFSYDGEIKTINHSLYQPSRHQHCATLDFFSPFVPTTPPTCLDYIFSHLPSF